MNFHHIETCSGRPGPGDDGGACFSQKRSLSAKSENPIHGILKKTGPLLSTASRRGTISAAGGGRTLEATPLAGAGNRGDAARNRRLQERLAVADM